MPYIQQTHRDRIDVGGSPKEVGELNYLITRLIDDYLGSTRPSYSAFNSIIGVLECAKLEFYRRMVAPYEDKKIKENGDVYQV